MNVCLASGYFPTKFKEAIITLTPKQGKNPAVPLNYRPISLLEVPGKILEKIINNRLRNHLETTNRANCRQFGFRKGKSTTTAIALACENIARAAVSGRQCNLTLRDVAKAFDKVWHDGLKYKILQLGLPANIEKLLCKFLDGRNARLRVGQHTGETFPLMSGVPQGSVLSPTLYIIYTSDTPPPTRIGNEDIMYADDITQITTHQGKSRALQVDNTRRELERVNNYEKQWKIQTSLPKFTVIPLCRRKTHPLVTNNA